MLAVRRIDNSGVSVTAATVWRTAPANVPWVALGAASAASGVGAGGSAQAAPASGAIRVYRLVVRRSPARARS